MQLISQTTLAAQANSVTISSITQIYRDLVLIVNGSKVNGGGDWCRIRINDDASSSTSMFMEADGSSTRASLSTTSGLTDCYWYVTWSATQTSRTSVVWNFFDYSQTNKQKSVLVRGNRPDGMISYGVGRWPSTAAVTSLVCALGDPAAQWTVGTTFTLYGIPA